MTYGDLDEISRKIQNRCGLEHPTKHTFWRDEEGKIYVKFWFDSLKLPDWLKDEDEELKDSEKRKITNTFNNNLAYTHEDNFEIVEFNTNEGWVKVLPDDQKIKIKESVSLKEENENDNGVEMRDHYLIYWPTRFMGGGSKELSDLNKQFLTEITNYYTEKTKDKEHKPVIKFLISGVEEADILVQANMFDSMAKNLGIEDTGDDGMKVFGLVGTAGISKFVEEVVSKGHSKVITLPGIDYEKEHIEGVEQEPADGKFVEQVKNILAKEDELIKKIATDFTNVTLKPYIDYKAQDCFTKWDEKYNKSAKPATPEQPNPEQQNNPNPEAQPQVESYKKNLLYRVYKLNEDEQQGQQSVQDKTIAQDKQGTNVVTRHAALFPQYKNARDWYSTNSNQGGEALVYSAIITYILSKCDGISEITEEMSNSNNFLGAMTKDLKNKLKGVGYATADQIRDGIGDILHGTLNQKLSGLAKASGIAQNQEEIEAQGEGQINVTTQTTDAKEKDVKVGKDVGILNIIYTSLFANAVDNLKEIRDTFSVSVGYQPKDVKEQPEGEQSAS